MRKREEKSILTGGEQRQVKRGGKRREFTRFQKTRLLAPQRGKRSGIFRNGLRKTERDEAKKPPR